ncbi:MAG: DUF3240 family protein [Xanthomonadaceae bacterium]|nr:DUF3240 family protein [Xanthomonadaceae bacterium]
MVRLVLTFPPKLERIVAEAMITAQQRPRFTVQRGYGHGFQHRPTADELIHGRAERIVLWSLIPAQEIDALLDFLRRHVRSKDVLWWVEPVLHVGDLA